MLNRRYPPLVLTILALALAASACNVSLTFDEEVEAVGDVMTTMFEFETVDRIHVEDAFDVVITVGESFAVEVTTNASVVEELDVRVRDGELQIAVKDGISIQNGTLEADVLLPSLDHLEVSDASTVSVRGLTSDTPTFDVSGASDVVIRGEAPSFDLEASGASDIDIRLDNVDEAYVDLSGATNARILTARTVAGEMSGASDLTVPSGTRIDVSTSGASTITER